MEILLFSDSCIQVSQGAVQLQITVPFVGITFWLG